jgi:hypothetical protein
MQLPLNQMEIFMASRPVSMKLGAEKLSEIVRSVMKEEPQSANKVFIFRNKAGTALKILQWHNDNGWAIWHKKLIRGQFRMPIGIDRATGPLLIAGRDLEEIMDRS